jgi:aryl-alcohol dehydrogenase-like predicted oxidoreductase
MRQGKVLYWGTSEWSAAQIMEAHAAAEKYNMVGPAMEQPEYNLFCREKVEAEFRPLYRSYGLGTTIWSPLSSGLLTGKYEQGLPKDTRVHLPGYEWLKARFESDEGRMRIQQAKELRLLGEAHGLSLTHLSLLWCLQNPQVSTVILGASKISQLQDNLKALDHKKKMTPELVEQIERIVKTKPAAEKAW